MAVAADDLAMAEGRPPGAGMSAADDFVAQCQAILPEIDDFLQPRQRTREQQIAPAQIRIGLAKALDPLR